MPIERWTTLRLGCVHRDDEGGPERLHQRRVLRVTGLCGAPLRALEATRLRVGDRGEDGAGQPVYRGQ